MRKVLVITYYWPPSGGSGVQRWVKFAKYFPSLDIQPIIYTPENPDLTAKDLSLEADIPDSVKVIKRPITEFYGLYRKLTGKSSSGQVNPINAGHKSLKQKLLLAVRGNLFIPDPKVTWIKSSVRFLKKYLAGHPVDVIVSTGPPHSMHLIAMKVSSATGIPWVADFRDPWTKMFYFKHLELTPWAKRKHEKLEKKVLDSADAVVAVSPLVQEEFQRMTSTPVELITNGFDEDDFKGAVERDGFFNITHTGLFASDGDPDNLWKALREIVDEDETFKEKLRIRLAGKTDAEIIKAITAAGLESNLVNLGYQNHGSAVREQRNASVLLLPLRKEPEYRSVLPGKLFEYLAAQHPILGIGQSDGAMARIINDAESGSVLDWDDRQGIKDFILKAWEDYKQGGALVGETEKILQYSRRRLSSKMAGLLERVAQNHHK